MRISRYHRFLDNKDATRPQASKISRSEKVFQARRLNFSRWRSDFANRLAPSARGFGLGGNTNFPVFDDQSVWQWIRHKLLAFFEVSSATFPASPRFDQGLWTIRHWRLMILLAAVLATLVSPLPWMVVDRFAVPQTTTLEQPALPYQTVPLTDQDFEATKIKLTLPTQTTFNADKPATIKIFKEGFTLTAGSLPKEFNPNLPITVRNIEVVNPHSQAKGFEQYQESVLSTGQKIDEVHLIQGDEFQPGLYTVRATLANGEQTAVEENTFAWGVVAVNVRRSIAPPGQAREIQLAVLDDFGRTVCDSRVGLTVTDPSGHAQSFSTEDGSVVKNPDCQDRSVTNQPDYHVDYLPELGGNYQVTVTAETPDGSRTITDSFTAQATAKFDVERTEFPTRIYPPAQYPVSFTVIPEADFSGLVTETLPVGYQVTTVDQGGAVTANNNEPVQIDWAVNWQAGQVYTLGYTFKAPDISPILYHLGPIKFTAGQGTIFQESRRWQIAADATKTWDGGGADANWSTCANWNADTCPANTGDAIVFNGGLGGQTNDASTWENAATITSVASISFTSYTGVFTISKTSAVITGDFSHASTGNVVFTVSVSCGGNFTLTTSGTFTPNTTTLTMTGTGGKNLNSNKSFYNLTIDPASTATINVVTNSFTITNALTIAAGDTMAIASGITVTHTGGTFTWGDASSTISGAGTLTFTSTSPGPGTSGVISSIVRYDSTGVVIPTATFDARTYYGRVEIYSSAATLRTLTLPSGNFILSGASSHLYITAASTGSMTVTGVTNAPNFTIGGDLDFLGTATKVTLRTGAGAWSVAGTVDVRDGTFTAATNNTFTMTGAGKTLYANGGFYNLTFDAPGIITLVGGMAIANTLTITTGTTVTFYDVNAYIDGAPTFVLDGTLNGPGWFYYYDGSATFPTTGTISCPVYFYISTGDTMIPGRTFGGDVFIQVDSDSSYIVTFGSAANQTMTIDGYLYIDANAAGNATIDAATYDPNVVLGGDLDFTGIGAGSEVITAGVCPWTVSGNVDFTDGIYTTETGTCNGSSTGSTLIMDGTGTLTSDGETLYNLDINSAGTVTLAAATHTVAGNLLLGGAGTPTVTSSTVSMTGSGKTIDGGGKTLNNLTLDGGGTTTLQNTGLTVSGTLDITTGDALSIGSGLATTLSGTSGTTLTLDGTVSGAGTLVYSTTTAFPTSGTISSILRMDSTSNNQILSTRTYGGDVEIYNNSAVSARTVTLGTAGSQTLTFSSSLTVNAANTQDVTLQGATWDPGVDITGDLDFTCVGAGAGAIIAPDVAATWTVGGKIDFTDGLFTPNSGTLTMTGSSKTLTTGGNSINNFEVSGGSVTSVGAADINGTFGISGGTFTQAANANLNIAGDFTLASGTSFIPASGSGLLIFDGDLTFTDSTSPKQDIGNVEIGASPDTTDLASNMAAKALTVVAGDVLNTHGYDIDASGNIIINGTLDATDDVAGDTTLINCAGNYTINSTATYVADDSTLTMDATTGTKTLITDGIFSLNNLTINDGGGPLLVQVQDPLDVNGNLTITGGNLDVVSGEDNAITVGGNWDNDDTFTARGGTVTMDAGSGAPTIDADGTGSDAFYNFIFNDGGGSAVYELSTTMDVDNNLTITGGNFDANGNNLTIGGNWDNDDTFTSGAQTTIFDAASGTKTIDADGTGAESFSTVVFNDSVGGATWQMTTDMDVNADLTITGGTLDFNGSNTLSVAGNFTNQDTMTQSTGTLKMDGASGTNYIDTTEAVSAAASDFNNITFDDAGGPATYKTKYPLDLDSNLTITGGTLDMSGPTTWYLTNSSANANANNWRMKSTDPAGSADDTTICDDNNAGPTDYCVLKPGTNNQTWAAEPTTIQQTGWMLNNGIPISGTIAAGTWTVKATTTYTQGDCGYTRKRLYARIWKANADLSSPTAITGWNYAGISAGTNDYTISIGGVGAQILSNQVLYAEFSAYLMSDGFCVPGASTTIAFRVNEGGTKQQLTTPTFTPQINIAGSWNNDDIFTHGNGKVVFDASTTGKTIEAGASSFYDVDVNNASGGWTVQTDNLTVANNLTLTAGTAWVVASGKTLEVDGNYSQIIPGANTTWTGSTLYLKGSGGMYDINSKTHGGDTYATVRVGSSEDIAMWDSSATTYTMDAGGCLFSEDHGATSGRLNVYGTCNSRANEYWSYATDFDGAALGGASRQTDIRFDENASLTVDSGDTLALLGQNASANRTLVSRIAAGNYGLTVNGIINAQYYDFDYLNDSGLNIGSTAVVTELSDGNFDNAGAGATSSYIKITNATSVKNFFNDVFDDNTDGADANVVYNVNGDGADIDWNFFSWSGNKGGEAYDVDANGAFVGWGQSLTLSVSENSIDLGVLSPTVTESGSNTITVSTTAAGGYSCSVTDDGKLRNGTDDIADVADGDIVAGVEEYGISCTGNECLLNDYQAISAAPLEIAASASPITNSVTTIYYAAAVDTATEGGHYSQVVTFTCSGDF